MPPPPQLPQVDLHPALIKAFGGKCPLYAVHVVDKFNTRGGKDRRVLAASAGLLFVCDADSAGTVRRLNEWRDFEEVIGHRGRPEQALFRVRGEPDLMVTSVADPRNSHSLLEAVEVMRKVAKPKHELPLRFEEGDGGLHGLARLRGRSKQSPAERLRALAQEGRVLDAKMAPPAAEEVDDPASRSPSPAPAQQPQQPAVPPAPAPAQQPQQPASPPPAPTGRCPHVKSDVFAPPVGITCEECGRPQPARSVVKCCSECNVVVCASCSLVGQSAASRPGGAHHHNAAGGAWQQQPDVVPGPLSLPHGVLSHAPTTPPPLRPQLTPSQSPRTASPHSAAGVHADPQAHNSVLSTRGGHNHRTPARYCGRFVGQAGYVAPCGSCDGRCGPINGCQCRDCCALDQASPPPPPSGRGSAQSSPRSVVRPLGPPPPQPTPSVGSVTGLWSGAHYSPPRSDVFDTPTRSGFV
eukprot:TRINITY_DN1016_c0_g1_i1.p1 TRINITY_DN1016_c0_g1~~TRINITY_DN1016_c0_g1_i1.p1  ORF type:complete len:484 (+),score=120.30 TRINITY_DN1016_c0_g1_i1:56-1453(+)